MGNYFGLKCPSNKGNLSTLYGLRRCLQLPWQWRCTMTNEVGITLLFLDKGACVKTFVVLLSFLYTFFLSHVIKLFRGFTYFCRQSWASQRSLCFWISMCFEMAYSRSIPTSTSSCLTNSSEAFFFSCLCLLATIWLMLCCNLVLQNC
jgi:hypothetical protein